MANLANGAHATSWRSPSEGGDRPNCLQLFDLSRKSSIDVASRSQAGLGRYGGWSDRTGAPDLHPNLSINNAL
jgi:hypothetical protein